MAGKNKVIVRIAGNEYTVCGYESAEYAKSCIICRPEDI